jgi:hypothetical protein
MLTPEKLDELGNVYAPMREKLRQIRLAALRDLGRLPIPDPLWSPIGRQHWLNAHAPFVINEYVQQLAGGVQPC